LPFTIKPSLFILSHLCLPNNKLVKHKWLKKLIEAVSLATNTVPPLRELVRAKKVAAGLEPERTNLFLQHFAVAAASGICSREIVEHMRDTQAARAAGKALPSFVHGHLENSGDAGLEDLQRVTTAVSCGVVQL
jgi:hypothetical protein